MATVGFQVYFKRRVIGARLSSETFAGDFRKDGEVGFYTDMAQVEKCLDADLYDDTRALYDCLQGDLLDQLRSGRNVSVIAFGGTGSGKSYTIDGVQGQSLGFVDHLFDDLSMLADEGTTFSLGLDRYAAPAMTVPGPPSGTTSEGLTMAQTRHKWREGVAQRKKCNVSNGKNHDSSRDFKMAKVTMTVNGKTVTVHIVGKELRVDHSKTSKWIIETYTEMIHTLDAMRKRTLHDPRPRRQREKYLPVKRLAEILQEGMSFGVACVMDGIGLEKEDRRRNLATIALAEAFRGISIAPPTRINGSLTSGRAIAISPADRIRQLEARIADLEQAAEDHREEMRIKGEEIATLRNVIAERTPLSTEDDQDDIGTTVAGSDPWNDVRLPDDEVARGCDRSGDVSTDYLDAVRHEDERSVLDVDDEPDVAIADLDHQYTELVAVDYRSYKPSTRPHPTTQDLATWDARSDGAGASKALVALDMPTSPDMCRMYRPLPLLIVDETALVTNLDDLSVTSLSEAESMPAFADMAHMSSDRHAASPRIAVPAGTGQPDLLGVNDRTRDSLLDATLGFLIDLGLTESADVETVKAAVAGGDQSGADRAYKSFTTSVYAHITDRQAIMDGINSMLKAK